MMSAACHRRTGRWMVFLGCLGLTFPTLIHAADVLSRKQVQPQKVGSHWRNMVQETFRKAVAERGWANRPLSAPMTAAAAHPQVEQHLQSMADSANVEHVRAPSPHGMRELLVASSNNKRSSDLEIRRPKKPRDLFGTVRLRRFSQDTTSVVEVDPLKFLPTEKARQAGRAMTRLLDAHISDLIQRSGGGLEAVKLNAVVATIMHPDLLRHLEQMQAMEETDFAAAPEGKIGALNRRRKSREHWRELHITDSRLDREPLGRISLIDKWPSKIHVRELVPGSPWLRPEGGWLAKEYWSFSGRTKAPPLLRRVFADELPPITPQTSMFYSHRPGYEWHFEVRSVEPRINIGRTISEQEVQRLIRGKLAVP